MELLKQLNFARAVILLSFIGSAVLGYLLYEQTGRLDELDRTLRQAPIQLQAIQGKALQVADLERQVVDEGLGRQSNPEDYIREQAISSTARMGQVEVSPNEVSGKGYVDNEFEVESPKRNAAVFSLGQIANFMYQLEEQSRRVRVTEIEIKPAGKSGRREHEILSGEWTYRLTMTTREKSKK